MAWHSHFNSKEEKMNLVELYKKQTDIMDYTFVDHSAGPSRDIMDIKIMKALYSMQSRNGNYKEIIHHTAHYQGSAKMYIDL